ncbi:MAG: glycosyltransferase [Anaerolineales bacterium]
MKIVFLNTTSMESPYTRGRCFPIAQRLVQSGHEVHIVTLHHNFPECKEQEFIQDGVAIHYVGQMHVIKENNITRYFLIHELIWVAFLGAMNIFLKGFRLKAHVYHIGKPHPQNSLAGLGIKLLRRSSRFFLDYDDIEYISNNISGNKVYSATLKFFEVMTARWVHGVTFHSSYLREMLIKYGVSKERIFKLPSQIDQNFYNKIDHEQIRLYRDLLGDGPIFLYLGSLSLANHPIDLLLNAFANYLKEGKIGTLVIAGGGPDLRYLEEKSRILEIDLHTIFLGRVAAENVPNLLRCAKFTIDPVKNDAVAKARYPLKILESLSAGVPVITGDIGDRREMLNNGAAGILVKPGDAMSLCDGMHSLMQYSEGEYVAMQNAAFESSRNFANHYIIEQLILFYKGENIEAD